MESMSVTTALGRSVAAWLPADHRSRLLPQARLERRTDATISARLKITPSRNVPR